jgi:hypothetical protein
VASRWSDDGAARMKKKTEWARTVATIQKSIEAMAAAELQRFGYDPISGKGIVVAEWEAYKDMGESDASTIRWPPAVFARVAQLANTPVTQQPDPLPLTLIRPPTALPPNIPNVNAASRGSGVILRRDLFSFSGQKPPRRSSFVPPARTSPKQPKRRAGGDIHAGERFHERQAPSVVC